GTVVVTEERGVGLDALLRGGAVDGGGVRTALAGGEFAAVRPDEGHGAVGVGAADRESVQAGLGGPYLLGGGDQFGLGCGHLDVVLLEEIGAVVQRAHPDEVRGAVDLAVHGDRLPGGRVGVLGLGPGAELLGDVEQSAVLHIAGGVGVAVLDDVGGA